MKCAAEENPFRRSKGERIMKYVGVTLAMAVLVACVAAGSTPVLAQNVVDFPGTVLKVDDAAGKLTVKKEGTRFTFVVDGRTQYAGVKALKEIKAGDAVTVSYITMGSQYVAQKIAKK
jgi:Cu/Ag efflux protein CusF